MSTQRDGYVVITLMSGNVQRITLHPNEESATKEADRHTERNKEMPGMSTYEAAVIEARLFLAK